MSTTIRRLTLTLTSLLALLAPLVAAPGAWAREVPDPNGSTIGVPPGRIVQQAGDSGFDGWQVVGIGAACALFAILLTAAIARLLVTHGAHQSLHAQHR